jgi:L,D-transpeptidase ErfK/SrfK
MKIILLLLTIISFSSYGNGIIGKDKTVIVKPKSSLVEIARKALIGQNQIRWANPKVSRWAPKPKTKVIIPGRHIIPDHNGNGIVINLAEYRLYHFTDNNVTTHTIGIGRKNWKTPTGNTSIIQRIKDPTWTPPKSIREEHIAKGKKPLPDVIPAGPNNPLGLFALRLGMPGYLIHGTNKVTGLGMSVSHGCIRMYGQDIKHLFYNTNVSDTVTIIDEPIKVGFHEGDWYVQSFPSKPNIKKSVAIVLSKITNRSIIDTIDMKHLKKSLKNKSGQPIKIKWKKKNKIKSEVSKPKKSVKFPIITHSI